MLNKDPLILSPQYQSILNDLELNPDPTFITGKAGTGKSTLLNLFRNTTNKKCIVLAPTGIAALNVKGQTIHSFFRLPPKLLLPEIVEDVRCKSIFKKMECLIIDEISMVRVDVVDAMDKILKRCRKNNRPFGGVQVIFFGDLFQLPPVISSSFEKKFLSDHYDSPYFFSSMVFQQQIHHFNFIELTKIYRQKDKGFIKLLNNIRRGIVDGDDLNEINQRFMAPDTDRSFITLCARNYTVQQINQKKLNDLTSKSYTYQAKITGKFNVKSAPTDLVLHLKIGAQVMFIRNDTEKRYVNGTIGTVSNLTNDAIFIEINDAHTDNKNEMIELQPQIWESIKYKYNSNDKAKVEMEIIGTFEQYPIKLAWAISIHKSQGKTFDSVYIDLGSGSFDYGQTYVALSRCTSLEGVFLHKKVNINDILIDPKVIDFYEFSNR